jgi:hypothetical protein
MRIEPNQSPHVDNIDDISCRKAQGAGLSWKYFGANSMTGARDEDEHVSEQLPGS